jgi:beta-lactam-binding protein with PASTA domain
MDFKKYLKEDSVGALLANLAIMLGILFFILIIYFYIYLPNTTNHGDFVDVPDLKGVKVDQLEDFLKKHNLRFAVNDSAYTDTLPPNSVLRQFPVAGAKVKEHRTIYISINRITPPTMPMPDLTDGSLVNAEAILKSNELKVGRVLYEPSPFKNLVREFHYGGKKIEPGARIPKGSVIDLIVGDGYGPADFTVGNLIGDTYERAKLKLEGWNLHLGRVEVPADGDTTDVVAYVYKQSPQAGDSVRVGDPIHLWIAPKGYKEPESEDQESQEN